MFDLNGNVIGINSALISPTGASVGIGLAIPAELAKPVIESLIRGQRPSARLSRRRPSAARRGYRAASLGLPKDSGEIVRSVVAGRPGGARPEFSRATSSSASTASRSRPTRPCPTWSPIRRSARGSRSTSSAAASAKTVTVIVGQRPTEEALAKISGGAAHDRRRTAPTAGRAAKSARTVAGPAHAGACPRRQSAGRRARRDHHRVDPNSDARKRACSGATSSSRSIAGR